MLNRDEADGREARAASASLTAAGLDVKDDQEDSRNQNEQQTGDKTEIVGFHCRERDLSERITAAEDPRRRLHRSLLLPHRR